MSLRQISSSLFTSAVASQCLPFAVDLDVRRLHFGQADRTSQLVDDVWMRLMKRRFAVLGRVRKIRLDVLSYIGRNTDNQRHGKTIILLLVLQNYYCLRESIASISLLLQKVKISFNLCGALKQSSRVLRPN